MRILLAGDYPNDPRLGSAKVYYKLQEEFRALGHECDVLLSRQIGNFPSGRHLRDALGPVRAALAVRAAGGGYDVIDAAGAEGFVIGLAKRLGWRRRTVLVSRSNGLEHLNYARMLEDHREGLMRKGWARRLWYPAVRMRQVEWAARLSDRLLLLNETDREFVLARGWKKCSDIYVAPHGVSSVFLESPPAGEERGRGILFCGSWDRVKGIDYLSRAFSILAAKAPVNLTILGGGPPEETIKAAFPPAFRNRITVLPRMSEAEVMREYRRHDVLAFPSTYEGFGIVLVEAMSQMLPVVATPVGAAGALIEDGVTGLLVRPRNPDSLAAALRRMLEDQALRERMAAAAYQRVRGMSWRSTALRTIEIYDEAHQRRDPAVIGRPERGQLDHGGTAGV